MHAKILFTMKAPDSIRQKMTEKLRKSEEKVELKTFALNMLYLPPFGSSFQQMFM